MQGVIDRADGYLGRASWPTVIIGLAAILLIVGIVRTAWLGDDALIIFRPVLNWLHGYGPVWNIDERVQAFTCPLWFLLITMAVAVTGELYITTLLLSIGTVLASVAVLAVSTRRVGVWGLAFALIGLALSRSFVEFATSGLENPFSYLLLALTFVALEVQKPKDAAGFARVSFLIALSLINRLDLIFLLGPLGVLAVCAAPTAAPRSLAALSGSCLLLRGLVLLFPITVRYCPTPSMQSWEPGWRRSICCGRVPTIFSTPSLRIRLVSASSSPDLSRP